MFSFTIRMVLQSFQAACEMFPLHVLEAKAGICDMVSNFYAIANLLVKVEGNHVC